MEEPRRLVARAFTFKERNFLSRSYFCVTRVAIISIFAVQQSHGWIHYLIHEPEPHILLFRRPLPPSKANEPSMPTNSKLIGGNKA